MRWTVVEGWCKADAWELRWYPDKKVPTLKSVPNGQLRLSLPQHWEGSRTNWTEGPRGGLETKFESISAELTGEANRRS